MRRLCLRYCAALNMNDMVGKTSALIGQQTLNLYISLDVKIDGESVDSDE